MLSLFGIAIVSVKWWFSIKYLYTLPMAALASFTSITTNSDYVTGAIVIFMVTGVLIYNWSNRTEQVTQVSSDAIDEVDKFIGRSPKDFTGDDEPI